MKFVYVISVDSDDLAIIYMDIMYYGYIHIFHTFYLDDDKINV